MAAKEEHFLVSSSSARTTSSNNLDKGAGHTILIWQCVFLFSVSLRQFGLVKVTDFLEVGFAAFLVFGAFFSCTLGVLSFVTHLSRGSENTTRPDLH